MTMICKRFSVFVIILSFFASVSVLADDGSRLWLRYDLLDESLQNQLTETIRFVHADMNDASLRIAAEELQFAVQGFTGVKPAVSASLENNTVVLVTGNDRLANRLGIRNELIGMHRDGFLIRAMRHNNRDITVVASPSSVGVLYGVFDLIRSIQTGRYSPDLSVVGEPKYDLRMLNHWDNLNRTIERGYAGHSLWMWDELPDVLSPRYAEYARANASVGINATVPNSVNADPLVLTSEYLVKMQALADVFRPYGVQLFMSINFASPSALGFLPTSDPFEESVQLWWREKVKEIYRLIPDFGGFLVKANSEGQPGPMDYGRTHADGANMLARALKPHDGTVIWRAFVYDPGDIDRAKQAYLEFVPFDGSFEENVIIQVKTGPVDFQPREPFSPLFGAMKHTPVMVEHQITQEYLGFSYHLVYLAPLLEECLRSDTHAQGEGSTVARMTDGTLLPYRKTAIAGVANTGEDTNWCGHHFAQANWYSFGRQAWDHEIDADQIADEWIRMTFTSDPGFLEPVKAMMMESREAAVNYMMPLGLHHLFAWTHHYGPEPWCDVPGAREDWLPRYYHNASEYGIGFDRTRNGSGAVDQYHPPLNDLFNDPQTCPEIFLLWFHHLPWTYTMKSGRTLWDEMAHTYQEGVEQVRAFQKIWDRMEPYVDQERFRHVQSRLRTQARDAVWWRDAIMLYFQTYSNMPIPHELERPIHDLEDLMEIQLDWLHHN